MKTENPLIELEPLDLRELASYKEELFTQNKIPGNNRVVIPPHAGRLFLKEKKS